MQTKKHKLEWTVDHKQEQDPNRKPAVWVIHWLYKTKKEPFSLELLTHNGGQTLQLFNFIKRKEWMWINHWVRNEEVLLGLCYKIATTSSIRNCQVIPSFLFHETCYRSPVPGQNA